MTYNQQVEEDIQTIMDKFDWKKVQRTMKALKWEWACYGAPTIVQMQERIRYLLNDAAMYALKSPKKKFEYMTGTGGFEVHARRYKDSDKIYLELKFVVTEWSNYE